MNLAQIRAKYPQYGDLSDKQLADALHKKFYSDLPIQDYYKRIGFAAAPPESAAVSKIKGLFPTPVADVLHQFADVPIGFQKGVLQGIRMVSDIFGANNAFSKSVKQNEEALANLMSAQSRGDQQEIARILKEAEDKGVLDQIKAGVKAFTVAPVDTLTSALGTAAPAIVAALGAKVLGAGALLTTGVSVATGAGMGAGTIKGTIYEETKKALQEVGVPESVAEERAQKAQEYGGQNLDQILAGAVIGGVAAKGPLEKGAVRAIANRISKNVAAREAAESVSEGAAKSAATGRIRAGVAEALPEAGQAAQEQIAANIAQQREGLDVPTFRGAFSAATMEGIAGGGLGAAFGGGRPPVEQPAAGTPAGETPIERAERLAAEKAAAAPPVEPAPPVEEPKVRKPGEPAPLPDVLDDATIKTIGFPKGKIHDALLGKSLTDPEIRTVLEEYKQRPNASAKTAAKIDAFLARLPEPVAPVAPPPEVETPAVPPTPPAAEAAAPVTEAPSARPIEPEAGGAGVPVAGGPVAVAPTEGVGAPEPSGVVPPVADVERPVGGEGPAPVAVGEVSVSNIYNKYTNEKGITAADKVAEEIVGVVDTALKNNQPVSLVIEGKTRPIVSIDRGMMQDDKGQRWGTLILMRDRSTPGGARLEVGPPPQPAPTPPVVETRVETPPTPAVPPAPAPVVEAPTPAPVVEAVTPPAPPAAPEYTEADIDRAEGLGLIDTEAADRARAELAEPEVPTTAMGAAFEKRTAEIKAQMDALRQKNGNKPAPKSKNRAKFDELEAQLNALSPVETGPLKERLEKAGATGVFQVRDGKPILDIPAVQEALKGRDPKMLKAVLTYIGVDENGYYLPTTYSADEAAQSVGLAKSSGANVRRIAETLGVTADVVSRFQAAQTGAIGIAKNVSEASLSGISVENPKAGVLYEAPAKPVSTDAEYDALVARVKELKVDGKAPDKDSPNFKPYRDAEKALKQATPKAQGFFQAALTKTGSFDFTKLDTRQLADIYSRASRYDAKDNTAVMQQLNAEVEARRKADRAGTDAAINRAYGKLVAEEEAQAEEDVETVEEAPDEIEAEDKTRRLSDEDVDLQQTRTGPVDLENSKQMDDALRDKSFTEAIDYAIKNARDDLDRQILVKVKRRAEELASKGVEFSFSLTAPGRVLRGYLGVATTTAAGLGEATTVDVKLNGFTNDPNDTLNQETLVHELVHAVTVAQINYAPQGSAAIKLRALQQELVAIYNQRYKAKTLTDIEKGVVLNALENPKELLAYGLTNGDVQNWLASIPSPSGGTFLSRMFDIVSQVLGLKGKENSALAELMTVSEQILDESLTPYVAEANKRGLSFGKQPNTTGIPSWLLKEAQGLKPVWNKGPIALLEGKSVGGKTIYIAAKQDVGRTNFDIRSYTGTAFTPAELAELRQAADSLTPQASPRITAETEKAVEDVDVIGEKERQTTTQRVKETLKKNPALAARVKLTDSMAAIEDFFVNAYGGQIRTAQGRLNPMVLLSRALDSARVSKAAQEQGGLGFEDGLIVAKDMPVSYKGVLERIATAAKERGETYESFRKKIDTVLYAHREHGLREMNKTLPKNEQITLLLPDAKIDELEAAFQKDDFIKQVSADLDTIRFNLLDTLVEAGRISKEQAQDYKDATGYIPFNRLGDYEKQYQSAKGANRGVAALRNLRKLEGSERQTTSPIENFSGLMDWATKEAMKNDAALRALKDMTLMGAAFKRPNKPKKDAPGDVVTVYDEGKPVSYYVPDPAHFIAFSIQDPIISGVFKKMQTASQILRAGVTTMPPFAIKQVFDDIVRAYAYAGVKNNAALVKSVMLNFPKNWVNEIFRKKPADIKRLESLGIVGTFDFSQQSNLKNILEEAGAKEEGLGSKIIRVMEAGAKASDLAVRKAVYDQVLKETGDVAQAESAAREIINFSRRGSAKFMGTMISVVPFFNAYARGMDKLATAAAGKAVGETTGTARAMFYKRMGVLTAMGLTYALMMQDDEEYQNLPDHVRDTNWVLPYGKALGFTPVIPVPAELAFFFKAIPERVLRYYKLYGTDEEQAAIDVLGEMTKRGIDVFSSPNVTPQLLRPFFENLVNHSWFLGRPLESQAQLQLRPFERYGTGTSDAMKAVAKGLEYAANATGMEVFAISPIKLENAIRGIFGTAAGLGLSVLDMGINPGRTDRPIHQQLGTQLTGLSAVAKDPIGTRQLDAIYDLEKKVEQINGTYNRLIERKPEDVDQFIRDNIGLYSVRGPVQAVMEGIRSLNQAATMIDRDTSLKPEERRQQIDELRVEQNKLAMEAMRLRKLARDIQAGK